MNSVNSLKYVTDISASSSYRDAAPPSLPVVTPDSSTTTSSEVPMTPSPLSSAAISPPAVDVVDNKFYTSSASNSDKIVFLEGDDTYPTISSSALVYDGAVMNINYTHQDIFTNGLKQIDLNQIDHNDEHLFRDGLIIKNIHRKAPKMSKKRWENFYFFLSTFDFDKTKFMKVIKTSSVYSDRCFLCGCPIHSKIARESNSLRLSICNYSSRNEIENVELFKCSKENCLKTSGIILPRKAQMKICDGGLTMILVTYYTPKELSEAHGFFLNKYKDFIESRE